MQHALFAGSDNSVLRLPVCCRRGFGFEPPPERRAEPHDDVRATYGHRRLTEPPQRPTDLGVERRRHDSIRLYGRGEWQNRATVLIETIPAAFEMDEILYELREHSAGLNCGRWDYIFSCIKKFRNKPDFLTLRVLGLQQVLVLP